MKARKVSHVEKRAIIARVLTGRSTSAIEAKRYGLKSSTVRAWCSFARKMDDPPAEAGHVETEAHPFGPPVDVERTVETAPPDVESDSAPGKSALERAREGAELPPPPAPGAPPPTPPLVLQEAETFSSAADQEFVLSTYRDLKRSALMALAARCGIPPEDYRLVRASVPSVIAEQSLRANAPWLAPFLREKMLGPWQLCAALLIDGVITLAALRAILVDAQRAGREDKPAAPDEGRQDGTTDVPI